MFQKLFLKKKKRWYYSVPLQNKDMSQVPLQTQLWVFSKVVWANLSLILLSSVAEIKRIILGLQRENSQLVVIIEQSNFKAVCLFGNIFVNI